MHLFILHFIPPSCRSMKCIILRCYSSIAKKNPGYGPLIVFSKPSEIVFERKMGSESHESILLPHTSWTVIVVVLPSLYRVRKSANPCVRDMPKYLRTCQMSVDGYPADMSIFLHLATRLNEVTRRHAPNRHRSRRSYLSCWRAARCSCRWVGRAVWYPCVRGRRCWAIIPGFLRRDTIAGVADWYASGCRFPNPSASLGRRFCSSWNRLLCSMLVMFLRARCWLVGAFAVHIQKAKRTVEANRKSLAGADVTLSDIRVTGSWWLKHCDTSKGT